MQDLKSRLKFNKEVLDAKASQIDEMVESVIKDVNDGKSFKDASNKYGKSPYNVRRFIKAYLFKHDLSTSDIFEDNMKSIGGKYHREDMQELIDKISEIAEFVKEGHTIADASKAFNVSAMTIYKYLAILLYVDPVAGAEYRTMTDSHKFGIRK
jgi:transposase